MFNEKSHSVKMDKAIEVFSRLSALRTGRANANVRSCKSRRLWSADAN